MSPPEPALPMNEMATKSQANQRDRELSVFAAPNERFAQNPHERYRALREHDPVHWDPYLHAWVVTSYEGVIRVLSEGSAERTPDPAYLDRIGLSFMRPFAEMMQKQMMFMDGANHARLRRLCAAAFTPRRIENLPTMIRSVADELLNEVVASGTMEILRDFAEPLPAIITARLLGVPTEDRLRLGAWVLDIAELLGNFQHDPARLRKSLRSLQDLKSYVEQRMEAERKSPTGGLLHSLMTAEVEGQGLADAEIVANVIITLIGGHETTTNLIASGWLTLLQHRPALEYLRAHPEAIGSAVEELLRYESPVQHTARVMPHEIEIAGKRIEKGAKVVAVLAAANRDPARFAEPDELNLLRAENRHVAFGWASHYCFGAPLARMEGQIAFQILLERLRNPVIPKQKLEWRSNAGLRGLTALQVSFDAN
jgi:pimeloyl-[acyl-carrier protein] synthase